MIDFRKDRLDRGMSQQRFADEIGVGVDVIRQIEKTGGPPQPANALKVAQFYGKTVTEMWPVAAEPVERTAAA